MQLTWHPGGGNSGLSVLRKNTITYDWRCWESNHWCSALPPAPQLPQMCWLMFFLPVVDHLYISILLNPQLAHNNVVNTTCRVCPCVGFIVPEGRGWGGELWWMNFQMHVKALQSPHTENKLGVLTWAAPVWWRLLAPLPHSSPRIWVWGRWIHETQSPASGPQRGRHWLEGGGSPALIWAWSPDRLYGTEEAGGTCQREQVCIWSHDE